ncbi:MAG: thiol:disulfide interchange protein DsbA/DsbL [Oxalicibacterium faecigallinarum]|uniref:thiol:disulfide interchange protein DsbA/DsbL n=1 Tax=Oxalicibacterium faecigallinarum TaxID=573741 RepID=UPI002806936C|nr:thiol:disulfide interchange protein DsbA/DsbL [Oxalicibacterium faecigallinarum]MDQ7968296.1 thiol:disulfide interchange protein DsbA/DsbL [Oxalicibacterium faecigallinarum]
MRFIQHLLAVATLGLVAATAGASPSAPVNGTDYRVLDKAQQTDSGKKIEVTEFFWYSCPHCNLLEPSLEAWVKKQGDKINFKRVPVAFRDSFVPQQKLYFTLEAMGKVEALHGKVFRAIHAEKQTLDTDAQILAWIGKQQGIDAKQFANTYNSFGVQAKVQRAIQLQSDYKVDGVPMVAIDGRFTTSPSIVSKGLGRSVPENVLHDSTLQVMDWLLTQSKK